MENTLPTNQQTPSDELADQQINPPQTPDLNYQSTVSQSTSNTPRGGTRNILFALLLIFIVLIIVSAGVYLFQSSKLKKQTSVDVKTRTTNTPTPNSPTIDPTAEWNTYVNDEYGFSTQYHPFTEPTELNGNNEAGQFTYLFLVNFGEGTNPLKSQFGYSVEVSQNSLEDKKTELIGHTTDEIESEEEVGIGGTNWTKLNYEIFMAADHINITTAFTYKNGYGYFITTSPIEIDQILSTFEFAN